MQIALEVSGPDSLTAHFLASVVLAAMIVGAWRLGQAFTDLVAAVVVWFRNRWGW